MDSNQIHALLQRVAADAGKIAKTQMLVEHAQDADLRRVLELALNPFKTYGLQSLPTRTGNGELVFEDRHFKLLDDLRTRSLTGGAARAAVQDALNGLSAASADMFSRVLRKDLRAGFSESTANKVWPRLIPEFAYMRCSLQTDVDLSAWDWAAGIYSQEKADGMFANVNVEAGGLVNVTTRQGNEIPLDKLGDLGLHFARHLLEGHQHHGEMLVERLVKGAWTLLDRQTGNGILRKLALGGDLPADCRVNYLAWDAVPLEAIVPKGKYEVPYRERLEKLVAAVTRAVEAEGNLRIGMVPMRVVTSYAQAMAHYAEMLEAGKEGTILKQLEAIWRDGDSKQQVKLKLEVDVDLEIIGFNPGTGKNAGTFGSIICRSACGQLVVNVNARSDDSRADIHARREQLVSTIMAVKSNGIMRPKKGLLSLFLPRLVELRTDKTVADDLARIEAQFEAAMVGRKLVDELRAEKASEGANA